MRSFNRLRKISGLNGGKGFKTHRKSPLHDPNYGEMRSTHERGAHRRAIRRIIMSMFCTWVGYTRTRFR